MSVIEARLHELGFRASFWFKPEIRELPHILMENEQIVCCVQGRYFGGFALLLATDHRILLIDKRIPYLMVEDIRYDMISEIDFSANLFNATIGIYTVNKVHRFSSWKHRQYLRQLTSFAQQRVMELRQYQHQGSPDINPPTQTQSLIEAYNYGQTLQLQPPKIPNEIRKRLPSPHVPRIVGAAALSGARRWVNPNPYTRGSFLTRKQYSRSS